MKTLPAAALAALVLASPHTAVAQNPSAANAPKIGIAVVDINYIFMNHPQFREKLDGMKGEVRQIETQLKQRAQQLMEMERERNTYNPGTPDYKRLDNQLAEAKAQFALEKERKQKEFLDKEAKAYYEAYGQVQGEIARYAKHFNIGLVLRYNGDEPDPAIRQQILGAINKPVQYQDSIDITPDIEAMIKRDYPAKNPDVANRVAPGGQQQSQPQSGGTQRQY